MFNAIWTCILKCSVGPKPVFKTLPCLVHALGVIKAASQWQDRWPEPSLWNRAVVGPRLLVNHSAVEAQDVRLQDSPTKTSPAFHINAGIENHRAIVFVSPYSQIFHKLDLIPFFHHLVEGVQIAQSLEQRDNVCLQWQVTNQVQSCVEL